MPIYIDPQTRQRIVYQADCTDITYLASQSDSAITSESVPLIGPWGDYTGSGGVNSRSLQMYGGTENQFFGEIAALEGAKLNNLNEVGQSSSTIRRRQRLVYRELKGF